MKVSFVGHASILIETNGISILSDPWWHGPCFGLQWWLYPRADLSALQAIKLDYIYISHGHNDHLHPGTLRRLPKSAKILVSSAGGLKDHLSRLGFDVVEIGENERFDLGRNLTAEIRPTINDDTLMVISDGVETCVNANDALHAAPIAVQDRVISHLKSRYKPLDYLFCGYGVASHFPGCYIIPNSDRARTVAKRQKYFNRQWARIVHELQPAFGFPFAADAVLLDKALWCLNEPLRNSERPVNAFRAAYPDAMTKAIDIAPGFVVSDRKVVREVLFSPLSNAKIHAEFSKEVESANREPKANRDSIDDVARRLRENLRICQNYLSEYVRDYCFLIVILGADRVVELIKTAGQFEVNVRPEADVVRKKYDLIFTTRYSYIRRTLTSEYGHEILFVGSGCLVEYTSDDRVGENLHRELFVLLRQGTEAPKSRFGDQPRFLFHAKQWRKKLLGRDRPDLYDLAYWIERDIRIQRRRAVPVGHFD